jgi:beta-N-acetylhexosaminidase
VRSRLLGGLLLWSLLAAAVGGVAPGTVPTALAASPSLSQLIGQKLMIAMSGTSASPSLLGRVQRGEVGGVLLYGANIGDASSLNALTGQLSRAAADGGQPALLIATDQEGGGVKRISWIGPTLSPPQMGLLGSAATAYAEGQATGAAMRALGVNLNLAPVADVPASSASFIYQQGRTWSFDAALTASLSDAFASGLEAGGELPSMKHFPGIGFASLNTDSHVVSTDAAPADLESALLPYRAAIGHHVPMIMLSNATYTSFDPVNGAGWSPAISQTLLRDTLGFTGVSITDSLNGTAYARGVDPATLALKAAIAGTDMIMLTGSETSTAATYAYLLTQAQNGLIPAATLRASYDRLLALKRGLVIPTPTPIVNGGFEAGTLTGWTASGTVALGAAPYQGVYDVTVGTGAAATGNSSLVQTFVMPGTVKSISFAHRIGCTAGTTRDYATVSLRDNFTGKSSTLLARTCTNTGTWTLRTVSVTGNAGHSVTLTLLNHDDGRNPPAWSSFDAISLK